MKVIKLIAAFCSFVSIVQAQNVGIGTNNPSALLHVQKGAVLFDSAIGATPVSGPGTRLMWVPFKSAFRVGNAEANEWDDIQIGNFSFASGQGTFARNTWSSAMGYRAVANGEASIAFGSGTNAIGKYSLAAGINTMAIGDGSASFGANTKAIGSYSFATGLSTSANGFMSTAMGFNTDADGTYSIAMGYESTTSGFYGGALGYSLKSKSASGFVVGTFNDSTNAASFNTLNGLNRLFQIGNGTADNDRKNALTVLQNGNIGIGELNPSVPLNFTSTLGNKISLYGNGTNYYGMGIQSSLLQLFTDASTADIAFGYGNSSSFNENMRIKGTGDGSIKGNLTVQNGKGLIRSTDGTQKKELTTTALVNVTLAAGASTAVNFTFPESFSSAPDVYVGNVISGAGGWAEVIMSVSNVTTTGGVLYINNPRSVSWSPNFTVKIIAIGPQ